MGMSIAPGFERERKQLLAILRQAAALSETLDFRVNGKPMSAQLTLVSEQLKEFVSYRLEKH